MKLQVLMTILMALSLSAGAHTPKGPAARPASLQGEWQLSSTRDQKHTDAGCEASRMIVKADGAVVFRLAGSTVNQGVLRLGLWAKPGTLDLILANGQTLLGTYERTGDDLIICFAEAGQGRPTGISPKGTQWAETWTRAKP